MSARTISRILLSLYDYAGSSEERFLATAAARSRLHAWLERIRPRKRYQQWSIWEGRYVDDGE